MSAYIETHTERFGVEPICRTLEIAPSSYYARRARPPSARAIRDERLTCEIARVDAANFAVSGADKVWAQLNREGIVVARCTVERLMRRAGLRGVSRGPGPRTTDPNRPAAAALAELVGRHFAADAPNRLWVADLTYCRTFFGALRRGLRDRRLQPADRRLAAGPPSAGRAGARRA